MPKILGYTKDNTPIYPEKTDRIYTQAVILCAGCHAVIRGVGGPKIGATCPKCHDLK